MRTSVLVGVGLFVAWVSLAGADEPSVAVRLQTLEGRLADAEARAAFAAGEKDRLAQALAELQRKASALEAEASTQRRRAEDLEARHSGILEREERCRAELDLCGRSRTSAEDQQRRCMRQMEGIRDSARSEKEDGDRLLEECRGRAADLEAHNDLLAAEKRGLERERDEKAEEIACNYDALILSVKKELSACQGRTSDLEQKIVVLEGLGEEKDQRAVALREAAEAAQKSLDQLQVALKGDVDKGTFSLSLEKDQIWIEVKAADMFTPKDHDLKVSGRAALRRLALALRGTEGGAVVVQGAGPLPGGVKETKASTSWDGSGGFAGPVARVLVQEGKFGPRQLAVIAAPRLVGKARGSVVVGLVPAAFLEALFPSSL